jgi:hypothetical protein
MSSRSGVKKFLNTGLRKRAGGRERGAAQGLVVPNQGAEYSR